MSKADSGIPQQVLDFLQRSEPPTPPPKDPFPPTQGGLLQSSPFIIKDSGERKQFASGMVRDVTTGKVEWHRTADGPMLERWAAHLTKGKEKYADVRPGVPNWTLAEGEEEYQRFRQSAYRHFMQWYRGERDEDHAAAVYFNVNGAEAVRSKA